MRGTALSKQLQQALSNLRDFEKRDELSDRWDQKSIGEIEDALNGLESYVEELEERLSKVSQATETAENQIMGIDPEYPEAMSHAAGMLQQIRDNL